MNEIRCFMIEPAGLERVRRRRWVINERCELGGIHEAAVFVADEPWSELPTRAATPEEQATQKWPRACACGRVFSDLLDPYQIERSALWRAVVAPAALWPIHEAPPGAMYDARWLPKSWRGADGRSLVVITPAGPWQIDAPSGNGRRWVRRGEPPDITVDGSVDQRRLHDGKELIRPRYHAHLIDGWLRPV